MEVDKAKYSSVNPEANNQDNRLTRACISPGRQSIENAPQEQPYVSPGHRPGVRSISFPNQPQRGGPNKTLKLLGPPRWDWDFRI